MNREVEERLVAMYFDNRDFEKNAKQTIDTLGQLKDSMNLEDSVKGFDVFSKMKRNLGMEQMQRSANKLKETFGSIGPVLNKAFQVGTGPLRSIEHAFSSLSGYVNKYLGFDFASKIVGGVESAVRQLTVQPVSQGFHQYETEVDSVKTIMSSTGRSIQDVTKNLDDLRTYADKTIYSLTDMTSNLGKFTNNGVELEDATHAMMGVANAAALAGQGTQQASMAMYNISQAIGVGKMTAIDWKSIENANMATKDLKNAFLEVAAAQNNLKKVTKDGVTTYYYVKDSKGNEIKDQKKWVEVNYKNFREQLSKGWLTSDTITATLAALSGTPMSANAWETQFGITDKSTIKYLEDMGKQALEAASQVRTFTKMMGTLKDAVASGWSQSFKLVFGDAEEATTMWTEISDRIGGILNQSANQRNEILNNWKNTREVLGTRMVDSGSSSVGMVAQTIYGRNGREILIDGIKNLMDVFGALGNAMSRAFSEVFGTITGGDLFSKTQAFEQLTIRIKEWLGSMDDSNSRLNKIFRIVRGVLSAFKLWKDAIRGVVDTLVRLLLPGTDGVLDVLSKVGDFFFDLTKMKPEEILVKIGEKIKEGWEKLKGLFTPRTLFDQFGNKVGTEVPILTWLNNLWGSITSVGGQILNSLGLGDVVEWFKGIWASIEEGWNSFTAWIENNEVLNAIGQFLKGTWDWIVSKATGVVNDVVRFFTPEDDGEPSEVQAFLEGLWGGIESGWNNFVAWIEGNEILQAIGQFLGGTWDWIVGKATEVAKEVEHFFMPGDNDEPAEVSAFFQGVWSGIETAWNTFVEFINGAEVANVINTIGQFLGGTWDWIVSKATGVAKTVENFFAPGADGEPSEIQAFFDGVWSGIETAWNTFVEFINGEDVRKVIDTIGQFLGGTWTWIVNQATGVAKTVENFFTPGDNGEPSEIQTFFNGIWEKIKGAWDNFMTLINSEEVQKIIGDIGQFLGGTWTWIMDKAGAVATSVKNFFVPEEGEEESKFIQWISGFWTKIENAWGTLTKSIEESEILSEIGKFFTDTWNWILSLFKGSPASEEESAPDTADVTQGGEDAADAIGATVGVFGTIKKAAEDIPPEASSFLNNFQPVLDFFEEVGKVFEKIFGAISKFFTENKDVLVDDFIKLITGFGTFFGGLMDSIGTIFNYIGKKLTGAEDADDAGKEVADILTALGDIIANVINPILGRLWPYLVGDLAVSGLRKWLGGNGIISDISSVMQSLGILFLAIAAMRAANVSEADIQMYGKYMLLGILAIETIIGSLTLFNKAQGKNATAILRAQNADGAGSRIAKSAIGAAEMVGGMAVAFALLPNIIKAIGEAKKAAGGKDLGVDILLTLIGAIGAIVVGAIGLLVVSKLADAMKGSWGGIIKGGLLVAAVIAAIAGCLTLINVAFEDEGGADVLAKKAEGTREAVKNFIGIFGDIIKETLGAVGGGLGDFAGGVLGGFLAGTGQGVGTAISAVKTAISGEDLTDSQKLEKEMQAEQDKLTTITNTMIKLAELMKSEDIANLKDVFADLSNFASAGTFGQGLNLDNFSKGFTALATTLVGIADALTQNDSALFRVMNDADLEEKLYKTIDALKKIMTIFNGIDGDALKFISGDEFFKAFGNLHIFFSGTGSFPALSVNPGAASTNPFTRFIQDINNMIDTVLETFDFEKYTLNEDRLNMAIGLISSMSDSITKASDALEKLEALKDKYTVQSNQIAVLKDRIEYEQGRIESVGLTGYRTYEEKIVETNPDYINRYYQDALKYGEYQGLKPEDFVDHYETEIIDPGADLATVLEQVLSVFDRLIAVFESHPNLMNGKYDRFADYFGKLSSAFGMFGGAEGVGSTVWMKNYSGFADLVNDEQFVEKYVDNLEKIYAAFQGSDLAQGEDVITFNGIGYVQKLFDAIQEGLYSDNLPTLDGTPIITAIGQAIGIGKETITKAITLMVQEGIQDVQVPETGGTMTEEGGAINQQVVEYIAKLANGDFFNFNIDTSVLETAIKPMIAELDNPNSPINQLMDELETKLGNTLDLNKFMDESGLAFVDEETGKKTNVFSYITELSNQLSDSLNSQDPITFGVRPVFELDVLTRENLQKQLDEMNLTTPIGKLPNVRISYEGLGTSLGLDQIRQKLDGINDSIGNWGLQTNQTLASLSGHMDGIRDEIARMQMVLDSGVLVAQMLPMIDKGLYSRALLEYRSGTAPRNSSQAIALPK